MLTTLFFCKNQGNEVEIQKLLCLGHWPSNFPGKHFAIIKSDADYKCAVSNGHFSLLYLIIYVPAVLSHMTCYNLDIPGVHVRWSKFVQSGFNRQSLVVFKLKSSFSFKSIYFSNF